MTPRIRWFISFTIALALLLSLGGRAYAAGPLASWNEGPNKQAILEFVAKTTDPTSPDFVPVEER